MQNKGVLLSFLRISSTAIKENILRFISIFFLFLTTFFALYNGKDAYDALGFSVLSIQSRLLLFLLTFFDIQNTFSAITFLTIVLTSFFAALSSTFTLVYFIRRKVLIKGSGFYQGFGLIFALLGASCAACGTLVVTFLTGIGITGGLTFLPYDGEILGLVGLVIMILVAVYTSKQIDRAGVC